MDELVDILIVDDDDGHAELVRRNLRRAGITNRLVPLANGDVALDYVFCRGPYARRDRDARWIMLLDLNMPGSADGIDVLRQIKERPETRQMPVIVLTTTDDPRQVNRCYELGCNVYITKPVAPAEFIDAVNRLGLFISIVSTPSEEKAVVAK